MSPIANPIFHTVSVHNCEAPSPAFVGAGVLLRIDGKDYIATAAHVVDELPIIVMIGLVKPPELKGSMDRPSRLFAAKQQDATNKFGLDLALLKVTNIYREFIMEAGMSFFDLDNNTSPTGIGECFISGFPAKMNYYDSRRNAYAETCGCRHIQSYMENPERVRAIGGDPEFHFALEMRSGWYKTGILKPVRRLPCPAA